MKKYFIILVILIGKYTFSQAQSSQVGTIKNPEFGINFGFNDAYVTQNQGDNKSGVVGGINFGLSAEYYFSDRWGIKAKVIYDQKGWGNGYLTTSDGSTLDNVNFQLNYITVPIMANWHFAPNRNWYLNFGPYIGFLQSAKETTDNIDTKSAFNSTDFGLGFGIGVKIPLSNSVKLFFELEGQSGVSNLNIDNSGSTLQSERSSINIGINF